MAATFLEEKRPELIQRVTEVMPIADQLLSQGFIGQETYANIQAAATSQDKMRRLFHGLRSAGTQGKLAFYKILQAQHHDLVEELWTMD
ncbi:NACHT, LRR and PYD domains-containing protein 1a allele 5-like [Engraulis encrasicolus]|uniref:NACHT, LRR and PYD domains-containing protein 1a allele 5-like n=1 Tax=Engraulis encrasicolus TaxID=184585 RepID=UPI002FD55357